MATVDPKEYYGYLFEVDKKPTKVLDALLRGVADYISHEIGNKEEKTLTPEKLAAFYKAVGGNYDSLFVAVPNPSISWIYASIGCQHTLQPTSDDFVPPSIPALTSKGFVRWQSIEILLGPEEHVPFLQNAIRDFAIKHPDTNEPFPHPLPTEAFPLVADSEIEKWHDQCAQELRKRASPSSDESRPHLPPRPKVEAAYVHVRPTRMGRAETEYFEPKSRTAPQRPFYTHVPSASAAQRPARPLLSRSPSHRARQFLAPEDHISDRDRMARGRRRSYPENLNSSPESRSSPVIVPPPEVNTSAKVRPVDEHVRRHSHPRRARRGSFSSDASSSSDGESPPSPKHVPAHRRRSHHDIAPPVAVRYSMPPPPEVLPDPRRPIRERGRDVEEKRKSFPAEVVGFGKRFLAKRGLSTSRDRSRDHDRERERERGERGNLRWKDLDGVEVWRRGSGGSGEEGGRGSGESARRTGDRERRREREHPRISGRHSSHEDVHRREREGLRDRDRDREPVPVSVRGGGERSFRDRERERERERERDVPPTREVPREIPRERRYGSPIRGVDGRRYPAH